MPLFREIPLSRGTGFCRNNQIPCERPQQKFRDPNYRRFDTAASGVISVNHSGEGGSVYVT